MPITLNHSNIGVQYSSDKSYIIETVKSDLYRRNETVDTITRDNIQTAPVTPTTFVDNSGNIYAVESYTYSGTANTADFTRVFTKSTTCDILVVGGGGGGGKRHGGGGGAGTLLYHKNVILNGTYNIKVGKGGAGHPTTITTTTSTALDGNFSQFVKSDGTQNYYAVGGGRGTGSLGPPNPAPYVYARTNGGQGFLYDSNITLSPDNIFNGVAVAVSNKQYVNTLPLPEGCRGNIGGIQINDAKGGGGGGAGGAGMNHGEESTLDDGYGGLGLAIDITGTSVVYAGGGNGTAWNSSVAQVFDPAYPTIQSRGGGGFGSDNGTPQNGLDGTGGGGGAQGSDTNGIPSGAGGSGIVIIRYLLGTIPATNYLTNEPVVIAPVFTETIRSFTHSGGTENQTTHTITIGQNTICDILMIGGGGGGGKDRAGGGGSGALILSIGNILSGTYTISVGKGSLGATTGVNPVNGYDCEIVNSTGTVIFRAKGGGGGNSLNDSNPASDGGSGGGRVSQWVGLGGNAVSTNIVNGITTGPVVTATYGVYGKDGGRNTTGWNGSNGSAMDGAGGGGIGEGGSDTGSLVPVDNQFVANSPGKGGDGLYFATINGVTYNFKNNFNVNGIQDGTTGNFFIGGGGGGGGGNSEIGGKGGGGAGGTAGVVGVSATGYGSGGGGGGSADANGGNGSAGIVVIKFRTIVGAGILDGITHKRLNFAFDSLGYSFDATKYAEYQAQQKTGVGGWRIVRFLPPNLGRWYQGDYINSTTFTIPTIGTPYNYTNEWAVSFGTFDEMFFATFDMTYWLHCLKTSVLGNYDNGARPIIKSSERNYAHSINWYNRTGVSVDPFISINNHTATPNLMVYADNNSPDHSSLRNAYGGMCVLVRDSATGATIPNPNTYTLNFPVPTLADINNNSNIVLRGAYDIALNTRNAIVIPKTGQYIPKPTTFSTSNLSIRYNILNPMLDTTGAQWTYNTSNTNVYHMGSVGIGTTNPEYQLDVSGTLNAKTYYFNGVQIGRLSEGMVANVQHLTYTHMEIKNNTGWDAINDDLTTGFVISITPKSNLSKILVNLIAHIGLTNANDGRWWGIKLYRKIGTAAWAEVTGPNGTETGSAATTAGTPVWISHNIGTTGGNYPYHIINLTGTYLDSPNTTSIVYYTAYWNQRIGDNPSRTGELWLNRAENQNDAYRPAPSSSWTLKEIWYG